MFVRRVRRSLWMLMLATIGVFGLACFCPVTKSTPAMTCDQVELPAQSWVPNGDEADRLGHSVHLPPDVPATCVPWPLQSTPFRPSPT